MEISQKQKALPLPFDQVNSTIGHSKENLNLKEYYEIVGEARPLSGFVPTHADFLYGNASLIMKLQSIPQLLNDFLLRQYLLGDRVWAGITR